MSGDDSFIGHLVELRKRLMLMVGSVLGVALILMPFSRRITTWLSQPVMSNLPADSSMVAIDITAPLMIPIKMTLFAALFASMPLIIYQVWAFVSPGLYKQEKRIALPIVISSCLLFYLGCAFAYFVVIPLGMGFIANFAPEGITFMPDIKSYLDFMLVVFFAFGMAFEVPVVVLILISTGVTTAETLRKKRAYVIVIAFTVGMLLTPPDIYSQTFLAIPIWLLYELGIMFSVFLKKQPEQSDAAEQDPPEMT